MEKAVAIPKARSAAITITIRVTVNFLLKVMNLAGIPAAPFWPTSVTALSATSDARHPAADVTGRIAKHWRGSVNQRPNAGILVAVPAF